MKSDGKIAEPLGSEEIKRGIAGKVADAVSDELGKKTCNLHETAYKKFRATLKGTVTVCLEMHPPFGPTVVEEIALNIDLEIKEAPPNQFRRDTGQLPHGGEGCAGTEMQI
jgi:hypothetical protein